MDVYVRYKKAHCRQVLVAKHFRPWHAMSAANATVPTHPGARKQHRAHLCSRCVTSLHILPQSAMCMQQAASAFMEQHVALGMSEDGKCSQRHWDPVPELSGSTGWQATLKQLLHGQPAHTCRSCP